ncbi:MAG: hypothetical protein M3Q97_04125, partial [Bacteroidota bacterium]|nr:hypothetical protein [Bacteroidota bacterium]
MEALKFTFIFLIIATVQVFILDNIQIPGLSHPDIYFYFIAFLPIMPGRWLMMIAFGVGLCIDLFEQTPGINAAACV